MNIGREVELREAFGSFASCSSGRPCRETHMWLSRVVYDSARMSQEKHVTQIELEHRAALCGTVKNMLRAHSSHLN